MLLTLHFRPNQNLASLKSLELSNSVVPIGVSLVTGGFQTVADWSLGRCDWA